MHGCMRSSLRAPNRGFVVETHIEIHTYVEKNHTCGSTLWVWG